MARHTNRINPSRSRPTSSLFASHRSLAFAPLGKPTALSRRVMGSAFSPRLKRPTALSPPLSGLAQISSGPSAETRSPWYHPMESLINRNHRVVGQNGDGLRGDR